MLAAVEESHTIPRHQRDAVKDGRGTPNDSEKRIDSKSLNALGPLLLAMNPVVARSARLPSGRTTGRRSTWPTATQRRDSIIDFSGADVPVREEWEKPSLARSGTESPRSGRIGMLDKLDDSNGVLNNKALVGMLAMWSLLFLRVSAASAAPMVGDLAAPATSGSGFIQSFLLIFASEIGDKTFFIAGLLAAKYSRLISLVGSLGALSAMTIISCVIGRVFHSLPPGLTQGLPLDDYAAVAAFAYFGIKTLTDAYQLPEGDSSGIEEEKKEAEEAVDEVTGGDTDGPSLAAILSTFGLVFAAEVGDRSFFTTIALSAALNPFAVAFGAIAGHAVATGVAVLGGSLMSKYLSEKVIGYIGGSLFLIFAITTGLGVF